MTARSRKERIFACFTDPQHAEWLYGDLLEEAHTKGRMWFGVHYLKALVALFWHTLKTYPFHVFGIAGLQYACGLLIQMLFALLTRNMPITAFMQTDFMGDNILYPYVFLKSYEAICLFLTGMLMRLLSRHSVAGIVLNFLTWGFAVAVGYTSEWIYGRIEMELYVLLMLQYFVWYGALLGGSNFMAKFRAA
jgi:hypothetical protein